MSRARISPAFLLAAALTLGAAATACSGEDDDSVEPGEVVRAGSPAAVPAGLKTGVRVPGGQLSIKVGNPVSEVDPMHIAGDGPHSASGDNSLVGVMLEWNDEKRAPDWQAPLLPPGTIDTVVTVVAGDHRIELEPPNPLEVAAYFVGVEGETEPTIEVEYDGVTQTVDPSGTLDAAGAAGLYDKATEATPVESRCDTERLEPSVTVDMTCVQSNGAMAYVVDAGWAPKAGTWTVVSLRTSYDDLKLTADGGATSYTVESVDDSSTLGSQVAKTTVVRAEKTDGFDGTLVFEPTDASATLEIHQVLGGTRSGDGTGPATRTFQFHRVT